MQRWIQEAIDRFPDALLTFQEEAKPSPFYLWNELCREFECAYDSKDMQTVRRVYEFADWCIEQSCEGGTEDLHTAVAVCFYEEIPSIPAALADMPNWFSRDDVIEMRDIFSCKVGESGFEKILALFGDTED